MVDSITLSHATPRWNLRSILVTGLQPGLAHGKLKAVWLHAAAKRAWAIKHVASRHQVASRNVVILTVTVPRSSVRRNRRGIWYCLELIPPGCIIGVNGLKLFAA